MPRHILNNLVDEALDSVEVAMPRGLVSPKGQGCLLRAWRCVVCALLGGPQPFTDKRSRICVLGCSIKDKRGIQDTS